MMPGDKYNVGDLVSVLTDEYPDEGIRPQFGRVASCLERHQGTSDWGLHIRPHKGGLILAKPNIRTDCKVCGVGIHESTFRLLRGTGERCKRYSVCQGCDFWFEALAWHHLGDETLGGLRVLRIDGHQYVVHDDDAQGEKGFGGQSRPYILLDFPKIKGEDLVFDTRNMHYLGEIPEWWRKLLPDNARFENPKMTLHPAKV